MMKRDKEEVSNMKQESREDLLSAVSQIEKNSFDRGYREGYEAAYRRFNIGKFLDNAGNVDWKVGENPKCNGEYIVTLIGTDSATSREFKDGNWHEPDGRTMLDSEIIAWAKMPLTFRGITPCMEQKSQMQR